MYMYYVKTALHRKMCFLQVLLIFRKGIQEIWFSPITKASIPT